MNFKLVILFLFISHVSFSQNVPPVVVASGNSVYCAGSSNKIVSALTITDPDDLSVDKVFIQISSGYVIGQDMLTLSGINPNIVSTWDSLSGKLTLMGVSSNPTYIEFIAAIKNVEFSTNNVNPSGNRSFTISIGDANFLPSTQHYYLFIPSLGVTWSQANALANASTYYGLQGYLATLTTQEEAIFAGQQSSGTGWIGANDAAIEGTFKWVTGPEAGTNVTYTNWNSGEPNNLGDEDYVHITDPSVGILGSWNDLTITGTSSGPYQPQGFIVEYGGMPGDQPINIATSTSMIIPYIIEAKTESVVCDSGTFVLNATSNAGIIYWFDDLISTIPIATGNTFTTPILNASKIYYACVFTPGCGLSQTRVQVDANVQVTPIITVVSANAVCKNEKATLIVSVNNGFVRWYDSLTSTNPIALGVVLQTDNLINNTTFYAEASSAFCSSGRVPIEVIVNDLPIVSDEKIDLCKNDVIQLNAGVSGLSYLWNTGDLSQQIPSNGATNYSVKITNTANCSIIKNFEINYYDVPVITQVKINNLDVEVIVEGNGIYQYSLDNIVFQASNLFKVDEGGVYTVYVKEIGKNCGSDTQEIVVIDYPEFFTPNNDGINDTWGIKGMSIFPNASVQVYDRFGKLITVLDANNLTWDGKLNTNNLPSTDYWFIAKLNSTIPEKKGHFSLKR
jgi:gliding motility-associated-like protein